MNYMSTNFAVGSEIYSRVPNGRSLLEITLRTYGEIGINRIDTAECYGSGLIEEYIGSLSGKIRKNILIDTKFGHIVSGSAKIFDVRLIEVSKQLEKSLKSLKCDSIHTYYFHSGDNDDFPNEEVWEYLLKKKQDGNLLKLGISLKHGLVKAGDTFQLQKALKYGISSIQCVLNPLNKESLDYVIPFCRSYGIEVTARIILSKGLIFKKTIEDLSALTGISLEEVAIINEALMRKSEQHSENARKLKLAVTLVWCLGKVDKVIIAQSTASQLIENLSVVDYLLQKVH